MSTLAMSGDDTYRLVLTHCITGISSILMQGLLCALTTSSTATSRLPTGTPMHSRASR